MHSARATRVRGSTVQVTGDLNLSRPSLPAQHVSRGSEGTVTRVRTNRLPESPRGHREDSARGEVTGLSRGVQGAQDEVQTELELLAEVVARAEHVPLGHLREVGVCLG